MDSTLYLKRAENELKLAKIIYTLSERPDVQNTTFDIKDPETFYSAAISHAYYTIFYAAKAYLLTKGIKTEAPDEHLKTYEAFNKLVQEGTLDVELLKIYEKILVRAETLLHIFKLEKSKRGTFTYRTLPQANQEPAQESIQNATTFYRHINDLRG